MSSTLGKCPPNHPSSVYPRIPAPGTAGRLSLVQVLELPRSVFFFAWNENGPVGHTPPIRRPSHPRSFNLLFLFRAVLIKLQLVLPFFTPSLRHCIRKTVSTPTLASRNYTSRKRNRKMPPKKEVKQEKILGRPGNNLKSGIVCEDLPTPLLFYIYL